MAIYTPYFAYDINELKRFYKSLKHVCFRELTEKRRKEIEIMVERLRPYFTSKSNSQLCLMCFTAEKMRVSNRNYGINSDAEKIYFYLKMVDPTFKFLEIYEAANTKEQLKDFLLKNYHFNDPNIIRIEKRMNESLSLYNADDLWARESIVR